MHKLLLILQKQMTCYQLQEAPSRITKDAAAHYLAKAYLSRASEINSSWNSSTVAADLAAIGPLCDGVIANHHWLQILQIYGILQA